MAALVVTDNDDGGARDNTGDSEGSDNTGDSEGGDNTGDSEGSDNNEDNEGGDNNEDNGAESDGSRAHTNGHETVATAADEAEVEGTSVNSLFVGCLLNVPATC